MCLTHLTIALRSHRRTRHHGQRGSRRMRSTRRRGSRGASRMTGIAVASLIAAGTFMSTATTAGSAAPVALHPIAIQRINLPHTITGARWPVFAPDGRHLMFFSKNDLWITDLHGHGVRCLTCGLPNDPATATAPSADLATPFPDGKRVFIEEDEQTSTNGMVVLSCPPSVVDCRQRRLVPVDYAAAEPTTIPP